MRKLACITLLFAAGSLYCGSPNEIPPYYYVLFPGLRAGGQRPTAPTGLVYSYDIIFEQIRFQWTQSFDPDFNIPVSIYRLYFYENGLPREFYRPQDLLDETRVPVYNLETSPFSGTIYFLVTGSDGSAESLPSNVVRVDLTAP